MAKRKKLNCTIRAEAGDVSILIEYSPAYGVQIAITGPTKAVGSPAARGAVAGTLVPTAGVWTYAQIELMIEHLVAIRDRVIADRQAVGLEIETWQQRQKRIARADSR